MVQLNDKSNKQKKTEGWLQKTSNESQKNEGCKCKFFGLDERVKIKYENSG